MNGKRLRELRLRNRLTQEELGKVIHVSKVSISGYESGNRTPDTETLQKLADFFEVTTDYLLGRSDDGYYPGQLSEKDEKDIAKRMEQIKKDLTEGNANEGLSFKGEPMSDEAVESLLEALEHAERIATLANKKYIPKKYRND